jgi:large subunit ribosomal protein L3
MSLIRFIGKKSGMTSVWQDGKCIPVTLVEVQNNIVLDKKEYATKKSILIGTEKTKESKINKPQRTLFKKLNIDFLRRTQEFEIKNYDSLNIGEEISIDDSMVNLTVDVTSVSKGKGFQGAMKRHGFAGLPASHGVSLTHRSLGSTGNRTLPGRVFKNKKMAGRMGGKQVTTKNLKIVLINKELSLIGVQGSIPGHNNSYISIINSKSSKLNNL